MGQDDETKPKGFLYRWVNKPKPATVKRIPCEVLLLVKRKKEVVCAK